jgi:hydroxymethylpyrimidine/phosphomethylpyrimidine kinase
MTAVTALTAQNTQGVFGVIGVDPAFIRQQIEVVLSDLGADSLKTGMLHTAAVIDVVIEAIERLAPDTPLVADPVMVAKGGAALLDPLAADAVRSRLIPRAAVLTPNLPEAEVLTGREITDVLGMQRAAEALLRMGARAVLVKGGHLPGPTVRDVLADRTGITVLEGPRIETQHTHGTGCTLASAVATGLARGLDLLSAIERARAYVLEAIRSAPGFGQGHGPLGHGHTVAAFPPGLKMPG